MGCLNGSCCIFSRFPKPVSALANDVDDDSNGSEEAGMMVTMDMSADERMGMDVDGMGADEMTMNVGEVTNEELVDEAVLGQESRADELAEEKSTSTALESSTEDPMEASLCSCRLPRPKHCVLNGQKDDVMANDDHNDQMDAHNDGHHDVQNGQDAPSSMAPCGRHYDHSIDSILETHSGGPLNVHHYGNSGSEEEPRTDVVVNRRIMGIENATKCPTNECAGSSLKASECADSNARPEKREKIGEEGPVDALEEETLLMLKEVESLGPRELVSSLVGQFERLVKEKKELQEQLADQMNG